jgi:tripartite-type tricarboxylate transporter receptor subunit TctC
MRFKLREHRMVPPIMQTGETVRQTSDVSARRLRTAAITALKIPTLAALALMAATISCGAQPYPNKPVRLIVPYATGAFPDTVARLVGHKLSDALGQQVVVDSRVGGSGVVGTLAVVKSPPDGYTLLGVINNHTTNPHLLKKLPYDEFNDLAPVSLMVRGPLVLAVSSKTGISSVQEFVKLAKSKPGGINFAISGLGSPARLLMEQFRLLAGINLNVVPYKGMVQALNDLVGAQVDALFATVPSIASFHQAGQIRVLAVTSDGPSAIMPGAPAINALYPGLTGEAWMGLLAPANTPDAIIERLNSEVAKVLTLPDVKARLKDLGLDAFGSTPAQFDNYLRSESKRWGTLIRDQKIIAEQ